MVTDTIGDIRCSGGPLNQAGIEHDTVIPASTDDVISIQQYSSEQKVDYVGALEINNDKYQLQTEDQILMVNKDKNQMYHKKETKWKRRARNKQTSLTSEPNCWSGAQKRSLTPTIAVLTAEL